MQLKLDMSHYDGRHAVFGAGWWVVVKILNADWEKMGKPTAIEVEINGE